MAEKVGNKFFSIEAAANRFGVDLIDFGVCAKWVISRLHPNGLSCPECSWPQEAMVADASDLRRLERWWSFERVVCPTCGKKFTAATGTALSGSKLGVRDIYLIAVLSHLGVSAVKISSVLGCHVDTVVNWQQHFQAYAETASA